MPVVLPFTLSCLYSIIFGRSTEGALPIRPIFGKFSQASWYISDACSIALEGMQPTLRHVPPSVSRPSTQAVFRPSCAQRIAQT